MAKVSDITAVNITLEVNRKHSLFILLADDGSINRLGTGEVYNKENDLYIGITNEPLFSQLMTNLTDDMLQFTGGYDVFDKKGENCDLSIGLVFADQTQDGFGFRYGSKSEGPPKEISNFVVEAVKITQTWYESQKKMTKGSPEKGKPRWKFW